MFDGYKYGHLYAKQFCSLIELWKWMTTCEWMNWRNWEAEGAVDASYDLEHAMAYTAILHCKRRNVCDLEFWSNAYSKQAVCIYHGESIYLSLVVSILWLLWYFSSRFCHTSNHKYRMLSWKKTHPQQYSNNNRTHNPNWDRRREGKNEEKKDSQ